MDRPEVGEDPDSEGVLDRVVLEEAGEGGCRLDQCLAEIQEPVGDRERQVRSSRLP